jgi:hypothetical protein
MSTPCSRAWEVVDLGGTTFIRVSPADLEHPRGLADDVYALTVERRTTHVIISFSAVPDVPPALLTELGRLQKLLGTVRGSVRPATRDADGGAGRKRRRVGPRDDAASESRAAWPSRAPTRMDIRPASLTFPAGSPGRTPPAFGSRGET